VAEKYVEDVRAELQAEAARIQAALKALGDIEQLEPLADLVTKVKDNVGPNVDATEFKGNRRPVPVAVEDDPPTRG